MNCSTSGLPVHHQLPEFTQTHVRRVHDAIQPSHPVVPSSSCPQSLPASESFPMSQLFAWGGQSTGVSALAPFLPKNTQGWSPSEWTTVVKENNGELSIFDCFNFCLEIYTTREKEIKRPLTSVTKITSLLFQIWPMLSCNQSKRAKISSPDSL